MFKQLLLSLFILASGACAYALEESALSGPWVRVDIKVDTQRTTQLSTTPYQWIAFTDGNYQSMGSTEDSPEMSAERLMDIFSLAPSNIDYTIHGDYVVLDYQDIPGYQEIYTTFVLETDEHAPALQKGDLIMGRVIDEQRPVVIQHFRRLP